MSDLHLHRWVFDTRALLAFAREQRLLQREVDDGYIVHCALAALFGKRAPSPFVLETALDPEARASSEANPSQIVLAYAGAAVEELVEHSGEEHRRLLRWDRCASKPVPFLSVGREVAFATRAMPVVRSRAPRPDHEGSGRGHGRELDSFVAACVRAGDAPVDRAAVYRDWLARQLAGSVRSGTEAAAELTDFGLRRFQRIRVLRKEQSRGEGRKRHLMERPDAVMTGVLRVTDADAFRALLRRGIGRHRAFGFGMLLLRRA